MKNGGYAIISHYDINIFNKVDSAYNAGKPILFYDDDKTCYFIDSVAKSGDDYVLVKGGKTITVTDANTVSSTGVVTSPTLENIKDLAGNLRFIEGNLSIATITGVTFNYYKWSLSGTHLMFVMGGTIDNGVTIPANSTLANVTLPDYINDKIVNLFGTLVDRKTFGVYGSDYSTQSIIINFEKSTSVISFKTAAEYTMTADRVFRYQFDLLIDNE